MDSHIKNRIFSGAFWSAFGGGLASFLMLLTGFFVARILGVQEFGEYSLIKSTSNTLVLIAGLSLGLGASKYVAQYRDIDLERSAEIISASRGFAFIGGFIVFILLLVNADTISMQLFSSIDRHLEIYILALICLLTSISGAQSGALSGFEEFKKLALARVITALLVLPLMVMGSYYYGLLGALFGLLANSFLSCLMYFVLLKLVLNSYSIRPRYLTNLADLIFIFKFTLPVSIGSYLVVPVVWICNLMLVDIHPIGLSELGIFEAANQFKVAILFVPSLVVQTVIPILSNYLSSSNSSKFDAIIKYQLMLTIGTTTLLAIPIIFFGEYFMGLYGDDFDVGAKVASILAFTAILSSIAYVTGQVIITAGNPWHGAIMNFGWAIILLSLTYILLQTGLGAMALAYSNLAAYICLSLFQVIYVILVSKKNKQI